MNEIFTPEYVRKVVMDVSLGNKTFSELAKELNDKVREASIKIKNN